MCCQGFAGHLCEQNINECEAAPCLNSERCVDLINGFRCDCFPGYAGPRCQTDIDECLSAPCLNGASCTDRVNGSVTPVSQSQSLSVTPVSLSHISLSQSHQSLSVTSCLSQSYSVPGYRPHCLFRFTCTCAAEYTGVLCQDDVGECGRTTSPPCVNGANCINIPGGYHCSCPDGFQGKH